MANMPSVAEATFLTHYNPAAEVPGGDYFDLSILNEFEDFSAFGSERNPQAGSHTGSKARARGVPPWFGD